MSTPTSASSARPRSTPWSGDARKAREVLGWEPKVDFPSLVNMMVEHDLRLEGSRSSIVR